MKKQKQSRKVLKSITFRLLDIKISIIILILSTPIILLAYLLSKYTFGSGVFLQTRLGVNKSKFNLVKIRSMPCTVANIPTHHIDQQLIPYFGIFIRKYKIDELPQLYNVIRGDMSLVGPRPCLPSQEELINCRDKKGVFKAKPGLTGLAQLKGIDMSEPALLAKTEAIMLERLQLTDYFIYIIRTAFGKGIGDNLNIKEK